MTLSEEEGGEAGSRDSMAPSNTSQPACGMDLFQWKIFFESEFNAQSNVMVLGQVVSDRLFGTNANPVGETVFLWNQPFQIVGVVSSKSWASRPAAGDDQFDAIYTPVSTIHELLNLSKLNTITAAAWSAGETSS